MNLTLPAIPAVIETRAQLDAYRLGVTDTTPDGRKFTISDNGEARTLLWHSHNGVGSITVPLKRNAHTARLLGELRTYGGISPEVRALCFAC